MAQRSRRRAQQGMTLIEMMIAIVVLATGLAGVGYMIGTAVASNGRNRYDSNSTMVAQMVLEQIAAQPVNGGATSFVLTDCAPAPTNWTIKTTGVSTGTGATLDAKGNVDWTQSYGTVPAGYGMQYVACGTAGQQITYDVRWNVMSLNTWTSLVTVSARQKSAGTYANTKLAFAPPVTLRTIAGNR